jgi:hypothetical protein
MLGDELDAGLFEGGAQSCAPMSSAGRQSTRAVYCSA